MCVFIYKFVIYDSHDRRVFLDKAHKKHSAKTSNGSARQRRDLCRDSLHTDTARRASAATNFLLVLGKKYLFRN
jgi:hypothetical protein